MAVMRRKVTRGGEVEHEELVGDGDEWSMIATTWRWREIRQDAEGQWVVRDLSRRDVDGGLGGPYYPEYTDQPRKYGSLNEAKAAISDEITHARGWT